jgi:hypothetical protein
VSITPLLAGDRGPIACLDGLHETVLQIRSLLPRDRSELPRGEGALAQDLL